MARKPEGEHAYRNAKVAAKKFLLKLYVEGNVKLNVTFCFPTMFITAVCLLFI